MVDPELFVVTGKPGEKALQYVPFAEAVEQLAKAEYRRDYGSDWLGHSDRAAGYRRDAEWRLRAAFGVQKEEK